MKRLVFCVLAVFVFAHSASAVSVSAKSAILMEASSGKVVYEKDADTRRGMASTTKIMTALIVLERVSLDDIVTVKRSCTGIEGSSMYLQPSEQLTVRDLLYGLLLQSGNDCAAVLADYVAGSQPAFVDLMNQKALELGLSNTHFMNPSGLPHVEHYSTARDMAYLTLSAVQNADFRTIVSTRTYRTGSLVLSNHNRLLSMCDGVDGVKTGFTKSAGRCLVSSAMRNDTRLICVTLSAPDDWKDHTALYEYGFSNTRHVVFLEPNDYVTELPVVGSGGKTVRIAASDRLETVVSPKEAEELTVTYFLPRFLYAPQTRNSVVGRAVVLKNGQIIGSVPLMVLNDVQQVEKKGFGAFLSRIFS